MYYSPNSSILFTTLQHIFTELFAYPLSYPERVLMVICFLALYQSSLNYLHSRDQLGIILLLSYLGPTAYLCNNQLDTKMNTGAYHVNCVRSYFGIMTGLRKQLEYPRCEAKKEKIIAYQVEKVSAVSMENEANTETSKDKS